MGFNFTVFAYEVLQANNVDPDQMPRFAASELGLHCLHIISEMGILSKKGQAK